MKEIKTIAQELRNYPSNLFIYVSKSRLIITTVDGEKVGEILIGAKGTVVL